MKNTHGGVLLLVKLQALACNFTIKSNTLPRVVYTIFKYYKWYEIMQRVSFVHPFQTNVQSLYPGKTSGKPLVF